MPPMKELDHIIVVLENPQSGKNVGSVCRAMKNMGLSRLTIAGHTEVDREAAAVTAIHAVDILENALFVPSVEEAVKGTVLSAGLSRRRGKKRKYFSLFPEELARRVLEIGEGDVALVFGNEVSGLSEEDMAHCNVAVKIPTSDEFPSLNLSHAVQVTAYEIYKTLTLNKGGLHPRGYRPIDREELQGLTDSITADLKEIGFFKQVGPEDMGAFFRDVFSRAALSRGEADRMARIFTKIRGLSQKTRD